LNKWGFYSHLTVAMGIGHRLHKYISQISNLVVMEYATWLSCIMEYATWFGCHGICNLVWLSWNLQLGLVVMGAFRIVKQRGLSWGEKDLFM
jgi:hypothetical protein